MSGLTIFTGNRLELLLEQFADTVRTNLPDPFQKEFVVVQSTGMERWISMELAQRLGICANVKFLFPNQLIDSVFRTLYPHVPEESLFLPEIMNWIIMKILPGRLNDPAFQSLRSYIDDDEDKLKRFQLSTRIAQLFDDYLLFRPEMILDWEQGGDDHWQAVLWRDLVRTVSRPHRAGLAADFIQEIHSVPETAENLPQRISIFGISYLPPFHLQVINAVSSVIDIRYFLLNPSSEFWSYIEPRRRIDELTVRYESLHKDSEVDLLFEEGNALLASMGKHGRDFLKPAMECDARIHDFIAYDPPADTVLACIQSDILHLRNRNAKNDPVDFIVEEDTSVEIHSCHGPMREMEILYDNLLDAFQVDPELYPKDILVMIPDIELYAPYIQAVFDSPEDENQRIPYSIADRSLINESSFMASFFSLLELSGSRFGVSEVLSVLESDAVQGKFSFSIKDIELIRLWVGETSIRWGIDQHSREGLGLPSFAENTWSEGLKRLMLGYAVSGRDEFLFNGILPHDGVEGQEASVLGRLYEFMTQLFDAAEELRAEHSLDAWSTILERIFETFFGVEDQWEKEYQVVLESLTNLRHLADITDFEEKVGLRVIKSCLQKHIEGKTGFGFLSGGVTFCAMVPMRSIPFKIICLCGMNDEAFPRRRQSVSFDLISANPRPGDRSRRDDDRYLFLETLLSAREKLYISYQGQDTQDNGTLPPSVVVSELLDYIAAGFYPPDKKAEEYLVTKHRLQPFSPEYFRPDSALLSYSKENYRAAVRKIDTSRMSAPFFAEPLAKPGDEWKSVSIRRLCEFYANPAQYLVRERLGVFLEETDTVLDDREVFMLDGLLNYGLKQHLVQHTLSGHGAEEQYDLIKAKGLLPHGTVGSRVYKNSLREADSFVDRVRPYLEGALLEPLEVDFLLGPFRISGRIENIYPSYGIAYRCAKIKPKDRTTIWIQHLLMNHARRAGYPLESLYIAEDGIFRYTTLDNAEEVLKELLRLYWSGLSFPLPFFPRCSLEYAVSTVLKNKDRDEALKSATRLWTGNGNSDAESENPYFRLCFSDPKPFNEDFIDIAVKVFEPLLLHEEEVKS